MNKEAAIRALFEVLTACNAADVEGANDFPADASRQSSTFGHIANAIESLGASADYKEWVEAGECAYTL